MAVLLFRARARLRLAARVGAHVAELMDFLGFAFFAQLARAALFVALALLLLLDLMARVAVQVTVVTFRFLGQRLWALLRASTVFWVLALAFHSGGIIDESKDLQPCYFWVAPIKSKAGASAPALLT